MKTTRPKSPLLAPSAGFAADDTDRGNDVHGFIGAVTFPQGKLCDRIVRERHVRIRHIPPESEQSEDPSHRLENEANTFSTDPACNRRRTLAVRALGTT